MTRRLLLTGARGFIGSRLAGRLERAGFEVHRATSGAAAQPNEHTVDLLDPSGVTRLVDELRATHLCHLAWITIPGVFWDSPENDRWADAGLHLLEEFAAAGGERALVAGSCAEYDWSEGVCRESATPLRGESAYARAKIRFFLESEGWTNRTGVSLAWGRVFFPYGPGEPAEKFIASVVRSCLADEPARCGSGRVERDYVHVDDVAGAIEALLASDARGPVNIGSGTAHSLASIARRIGELTGRPERIELGAREDPAGEAPLLVADIDRLRNEVGYEPKFDLEAGLRSAVAYWQSEACPTE